MKNLLKKFSTVFLLLFCFVSITVNAEVTPPEINAEGCALIDASTGKVLFSKNENNAFQPASTTKVMTAIVVLEHCNLDEEVTVTQNFTEIDGTAVGLLKGDVITVKDLLLGLLMESGNDCANALAIHVSGSIEEFAKLMNAKAKEIGADNTDFKNPSGLPQDGHVTTPHDLALILNDAINNKDFIDISTTPYTTLTLVNNPEKTIVVNNKNYMINKNSKYYYPYALCGKNGYTTRANHTYVSAAKKDGHVLVASFLNALDKNQNFFDMQTVFNYGFDNFSFTKLYSKDEQVGEYEVGRNTKIPLLMSKDIDYVIPNGDNSSVSKEIKINEEDLNKASFNEGDPILKGTVLVNGEEYTTVDLCAGVSRVYTPPLANLSSKSNLPVYIAVGVGSACFIAAIVLFFKLKSVKYKH